MMKICAGADVPTHIPGQVTATKETRRITPPTTTDWSGAAFKTTQENRGLGFATGILMSYAKVIMFLGYGLGIRKGK